MTLIWKNEVNRKKPSKQHLKHICIYTKKNRKRIKIIENENRIKKSKFKLSHKRNIICLKRSDNSHPEARTLTLLETD